MTDPSPAPSNQAPKSSFVRAVLVLVSGTAAAHGITALAMPVLSRLYTPADFGVLAAFSGAMALLSVGACLRYDVAVALPECHEEAGRLLSVAVVVATVWALVVALVVGLAGQPIATWLGKPEAAQYAWLLPIGLLAAALSSTIQFWLVRQQAFKKLSQVRVAQSLSAAGVQLGAGLQGFGPLGLIAGPLVNQLSVCLILGRRVIEPLKAATLSACWKTALKFSHYPRFSTLEALANSAGNQLPLVVIAAFTSPAEAGYLAMAIFLLQAPSALMGQAIGQVYLSRAPAEHTAGKLSEFTADLVGKLFRLGTGPLLAIGMAAPVAFAWVFGSEWSRAGQLVAWMTPWFILQFITAPISMALYITGQQAAALKMQLLGVFLRIAPVLIAAEIASEWIGETFAISAALFYLLYFLAVIRSAKIRAPALLASIKTGVRPTLFWMAAAAIFTLAIKCLDKSLA
jgi:O-antigen/teichoic acid export membrane protein